ncbi:type 11 methyltransferase [Caballeronia hypogeia]|uniref:Type 11 methyltransferase n=1 Tax=Caballeronia hypogeia TaxID=1777140 RepID=A0A158C0P2_9BURK|nr:class I SAM-dependent methyltransferase [Caballeronia hypogeia]SAK75841.1 type 11 methyltransferase [Caballeronia hypogeia]
MDHDAVNLKAYSTQRVVSDFSSDHILQKAEEVIFSRLAPRVAGGSILDIGVGCGRTTPALVEISEDYTGIDYSAGMVDVCKERLPEQRFLTMDARKLDGAFSRDYFDLVVFSFNGIDNVGHEDRLTILSKIHQILKPGGYFVFSSHNRGFAQFENFVHSRPSIGLSLNPMRTLRNISRFPLQYARHARNSRQNVIEADYAVINEPAGDFQMLQYYISIESQARQLRALGFSERIESYDLNGALIEHNRGDARDSGWVYYVATKP